MSAQQTQAVHPSKERNVAGIDNNTPTKTESLESMVLQGQNIAATHSLFERLVPMARQGLLSYYDIIIDEVPDVVRSVSSKSKVSIEEFCLNTG